MNNVVRYSIFITLVLTSLIMPLFSILYLTYAFASRMKYKQLMPIRLFLMFYSVIAANIGLYYVFDIFHMNISQVFIGLLYSLLATYIMIRYKKFHHKSANSYDYLAIYSSVLVFCITAGFLFIPVIKMNTAEIMTFVAYGEDNASHFALFNYSNQSNGLAYGEEGIKVGLLDSLPMYPQGFSFSTSWLGRAAIYTQYLDDVRFSIRVFYISMVLNYIGALIAMVIVMSRLTKKSIHKKPFLNIVMLSITISLSVILALGPYLMLFGSGFHPQIFSIAYLFLILYLLIEFANFKSIFQFYILLSVFIIGAASSWWFILPVVGISILTLFYLYRSVLLKYVQKTNHSIIKIFTVLALLTLSLYPAIYNFIYSSKEDPINEPGGIRVLSLSVVTLSIFGVLFFFFGKKKLSNDIKITIVTFISLALFTALIAFYQLYTVSELRYYYYKLVYLFLPFGIFGMVYFLSALFKDYVNKISTIKVIMLSSSIFIVLIMSFFLNEPRYFSSFNSGWSDNASNTLDTSVIVDVYTNDKDIKDLVFYGNCNSDKNYRDYIANRWSGALYLSYDRPRQKIEVSIRDNSELLNEQIESFTSNPSKKIIINGLCQSF